MHAITDDRDEQLAQYRQSSPEYNVAHGPEPYKDPDNLRGLYVEEGLTQREIAEFYDRDQGTISRWFDRFGIETGYGDGSQ